MAFRDLLLFVVPNRQPLGYWLFPDGQKMRLGRWKEDDLGVQGECGRQPLGVSPDPCPWPPLAEQLILLYLSDTCEIGAKYWGRVRELCRFDKMENWYSIIELCRIVVLV